MYIKDPKFTKTLYIICQLTHCHMSITKHCPGKCLKMLHTSEFFKFSKYVIKTAERKVQKVKKSVSLNIVNIKRSTQLDHPPVN